MLVVTHPTLNLFNAVPMHMAKFLAIRTFDDSGPPFILLNFVSLTVHSQLAIYRFLWALSTFEVHLHHSDKFIVRFPS